MFVGHYSASLVAKRVAPQLPLWALLLAAQVVVAIVGYWLERRAAARPH